MNKAITIASTTMESEGIAMHRLMAELYPICRSITGNGMRESLRILQRSIPLVLHEIPSGTRAFDWTVPREWNIRDAYVRDPSGRKVVDFKELNLCVLNYSVPVHRTVTLRELDSHLFSLPEHPNWTPYRTSYYKENWGFCLPHAKRSSLPDGEYEVVIDSSLEEGNLTYGELIIPGDTKDEVLLSCHSCHPSLCNDNLSGMAVAVSLAKTLALEKTRYTYRFLFIPGAIGSITWLSKHKAIIPRIKHGLVITCVGDAGPLTYKKSRRGNAEIDIAVQHVLKHSGAEHRVDEFSPYGYDERQYCSPGFNLPVGSLTRTPHGRYPEYHTSADNLEFVKPQFLADSLEKYQAVIRVLEHNRTYNNTNPYCEPQLGKRGLYRSTGGQANEPAHEMAMLWILNLSDGHHSLLDIAERSGLPFTVVDTAAQALKDHGLLVERGSHVKKSGGSVRRKASRRGGRSTS